MIQWATAYDRNDIVFFFDGCHAVAGMAITNKIPDFFFGYSDVEYRYLGKGILIICMSVTLVKLMEEPGAEFHVPLWYESAERFFRLL
jgi:hypothetical protein